MHRDEDFRAEIRESADGLLRVHVDIATARRLVSADGHESDIDVISFPDFGKALEVGAIAAVENAFPSSLHEVTAVVAMRVVNISRAPMMTGRVDDVHAVDFQIVPDSQLMDCGEAELSDEGSAAHGDDDALAGLEDFQAGLVEVIEVGVGDEDEIDERHAFEFQAGLALAFYGAVPLRPVRIDDHRISCELEEKGGVTYPSDADFIALRRSEDGIEHVAGELPEHARDDAMAQEFRIAARPSFLWRKA